MYILISDGGPQYTQTNKALSKYCVQAGITHHLSSALSPESNDQAEASVCTLKNQVRKAMKEGKSWQAALATHNRLHRADCMASPHEIFFKGTAGFLASHPSPDSSQPSNRHRLTEKREGTNR